MIFLNILPMIISIAILTLSICSSNDILSHDLIIGKPGNEDTIIFDATIFRYPIPFIVRNLEIEFPQQDMTNHVEITAILVRDNLQNGKGGYAYLKDGGVGHKYVVLDLASQRGHGFNFTVLVYGRKRTMDLLEFEKWTNQPDLFSDRSRLCAKIRGLTSGQRRVCRRHKDHMWAVSAGVRRGVEECQFQFRGRRWNCSVTRDQALLAPITAIASRETAFMHAITAAGTTLYVARACRDGRLASCGCGRSARPRNLHSDWVWAGCGVDLEYGYRYCIKVHGSAPAKFQAQAARTPCTINPNRFEPLLTPCIFLPD